VANGQRLVIFLKYTRSYRAVSVRHLKFKGLFFRVWKQSTYVQHKAFLCRDCFSGVWSSHTCTQIQLCKTLQHNIKTSIRRLLLLWVAMASVTAGVKTGWT